MEATQKKGFFRSELSKSLSRFTRPRSSSGSGSGSSKVVSCSTQSSSVYSSIPRVSTYSYASSKQPTSFHAQKNVAYLPSSMQKVSYAYAVEAWGHADESVDLKASCYISNVRDRFQLE
ncbi:Detected protein of unknown function [Hibiscus syriacus]|uniref:Uncharacterized protein n=1 Tax=Hibiscus syriacus TaxID=106335 RepID=A0A6A3C5R0_HIBSY|nr:Detected protein of unknown function [Hibiscus syriacus]